MNAIVKMSLKHDGNEYAPSPEAQDVKNLTKVEAAALVTAGVIELPAKPASPPKNENKPNDKPADDQQQGDANAAGSGDDKPADGGQ